MMKLLTDSLFRVLLIFCLVLVYFSSPFMVRAAGTNNIKGLRQELAALKQEKIQAEQEKAQTQSEINTKKNSVSSAYTEKNNVTAQITQAEIDIENSNKEIERVTEETNELLRMLQITDGENAYLELISNAKNMTDMIYYAAITEQLSQNNKEQLDKLDELIKYNEQLKVELAAKQLELENTIKSLSNAISSLGTKLTEISDWNADINEQIANKTAYINYYLSVCRNEDQDLNTCDTGVGYAPGWRKVLTKGYLTSLAGYRVNPLNPRETTFHNAHDMSGIAEGTQVYAAANGMVAAVTARSNCGGNIVYIHHNVAGKSYTTHYAHLLSFGAGIRVGAKVTENTVIGYVGGGSTAKRNGGYDGCTTGTHLHFGVANGHYLSTGASGYSTWASFLANTITPPGYPSKTKLWWYTR